MTNEISSAAMAMTISETIRIRGEVPNGDLYAIVCGQMDLPTYRQIIALLERARLVSNTNHMLKWIGPVIAKEVV